MRRRPAGTPEAVPFAVAKYGRRLLVDAGYVSGYEEFERSGRPHTLAFYDILLVTRGRGWYQLDDERYEVAPGVVFFTRPGDVRAWRLPKVDGACVFFARDFIVDAFADPRFLDRFAYFRAARPTARLRLTAVQRRQYLERFGAMRAELAALRADASHALRAVVYDLLVRLNRWYVARYGEPVEAVSPRVERFTRLVERDFRRRHRVAQFAADVGLTPGHLNALCRRELGSSAGRWSPTAHFRFTPGPHRIVARDQAVSAVSLEAATGSLQITGGDRVRTAAGLTFCIALWGLAAFVLEQLRKLFSTMERSNPFARPNAAAYSGSAWR